MLESEQMNGTDAPYSLLRTVASPADLRRLPLTQLPALARQLRAFLLHHLSRRGIDPAAAVGPVELTLALHYAFDTPN